MCYKHRNIVNPKFWRVSPNIFDEIRRFHEFSQNPQFVTGPHAAIPSQSRVPPRIGTCNIHIHTRLVPHSFTSYIIPSVRDKKNQSLLS